MPDIVIIGAGLGGLSFAIALKRKLGFTDFTIFEKAAEVGGTWRDNIYPGASSDTFIHFYSLSSDLNPEWPSTHGSQPDMLAYWVRLARKYELYPHIAFNRRVVSAEWDNKAQRWHVVTEDTSGGRAATTARVLISALGILEVPRYPSIPGLDAFGGTVFHSAKWDAGADLRGKRVAVIGNGTSAAQFVPYISEDPSVQVTQFCRTPHWFLPPIRTPISTRWRWIFRHVPLIMWLYRVLLYIRAEMAYLLVFHHAFLRKYSTKVAKKHITTTAPEADVAHLIPTYDLGCKRIIFDPNYLVTLHRPNLSLNWDGIQSICADGIITKNGEKLNFDVMIFATGFIADRFPLEIRGTDGRSVQDYYEEQGGPKAYIGTTVPGFPNMFMISGPNTTTGHFSVVFSVEQQVDYILKFVKPILRGVVSSFEVTPAATDRYDARIQEMLSRSVHVSCTSWYRTGEDGRVSSVFPGPGMLLWWWIRRVRWGDYRVDAASTSRWNGVVRRRKVGRLVMWALYVLLSLAVVLGATRGWSGMITDALRRWSVHV